jgi:nucleoside-diphosphate-sugar epimerase
MIGQGNYLRQPVYIWDVAEVIAQCLLQRTAINKTYNLGGSEQLKFRRLVMLIMEMLDVNKRIIPIPLPICRMLGYLFQQLPDPIFTNEHIRGLSEDTKMDIVPIMRDLNFTPQPLRASLAKVLDQIMNESDSQPPSLEPVNSTEQATEQPHASAN